MSKTIQEILTQGERVMNFHHTPEVTPMMEKYGYTAAKMEEGSTLLTSALSATDKQAKEYGEQRQASQDYSDLLEKVETRYMHNLEACRFLLGNRVDASTTLELLGKRKRTASGSYIQMLQFYDRLLANAEWTTTLGKLLITEATLEADRNELLQIRVYKDKHSMEQGEAQQATVDRDLKLEELDSWTSDYIKTAEFAFVSTPLLLKGLKLPGTTAATKKATEESTPTA